MDDVLQKPAERYEPRGRLDPVGFARHVRFGTYPPPVALAPFIEHAWTIRWQDLDATYRSDEVMHRPYVDLFLSEQGSGIQGTFRARRTYVASGSGRIVGVRFRPGAFHAFWDGPIADLHDRFIEVRRAFPALDGAVTARLLALGDEDAAGALLDLIGATQPRADANIDLLNAIIAAIEADEELRTVAAVARAFGRSERWVQQLFRDYAGIGLKWLLQRHRLLAAARQIRETARPNWAAIAYDLGYSSQQHFITAFQDAIGKTPLQYKRDLTEPSAT